jgi:hypothetical protein
MGEYEEKNLLVGPIQVEGSLRYFRSVNFEITIKYTVQSIHASSM